MKNKLLILLILISGFNQAFAQKKKEIRKHKIKTSEETVTENINGKSVTYKSLKLSYDGNGNVTEESRFNPDGKLKKRTVFKYNPSNNVVEEREFDGIGNLLGWKETVYNLNEERATESDYDSKKKLVKKTTYKYDGKGLKISRTVANGDGKVTETKTYTYE